MTKQKERQYIIREWMKSTGKTEIDMHEVAAFAHSRGWPLPPAISGLDRLAKEFSDAAREATLADAETGQPYREYHAVKPDGNGQAVFWVHIDQAPRKHMVKSAYARREQVVGDMYQLTLDLAHWSRVNPDEDPITVETDVTPDVAERLAASEPVPA